MVETVKAKIGDRHLKNAKGTLALWNAMRWDNKKIGGSTELATMPQLRYCRIKRGLRGKVS